VTEEQFERWCHAGGPGRAYGGQVVAQALEAAGLTATDGQRIHSLHGYFVGPGDVARPFTYRVRRLGERRAFSLRQVTATQGDDLVMLLTASFKVPELCSDRQPEMPKVAPPEGLPDPYEAWAARDPVDFAQAVWRHNMQVRFAPDDSEPVAGQTAQLLWVKASGPLPGDDWLAHAVALAYCSDVTLTPTAVLDREPIRPLRNGPPALFLASLDHAMWFHRPFRADEWMLYAQHSRSVGDGRALSSGEFWTRDGVLAATATQEAVVRRRRGPR
jgi:acyl-CoA thioesterase-2